MYFGGYYAWLIAEWGRALFVAATIGAVQTASGFTFEPDRHLPEPFGIHGLELLARYDIESIYSNGRRVSIGQTRTCEPSHIKQNDLTKPIAHWLLPERAAFCFSYTTITPSPERLIAFEMTRVPSGLDWPDMRVERVSARIAGEEVGSYAEVHVEILLPFPLLAMGCGMGSLSSWRCGAQFIRTSTMVGSSPEESLAKLLGLRRRTAAEIESITRIPDAGA